MQNASSPFKIFITLFLAVFVTVTGAGLVAPLLPVYANDLGASALEIGLIFGAFSLTRSIFVPYFGKLSDRRGKKPFLVGGLLIYFFLSLLYAVSESVLTLILLRLGQGFASAMILPVAQSYVGLITPLQKEGRIMGLFNLSLYGGLSVGPLLGGVIKDAFGIQMSFLSMGALAFLGFLLCISLLPSERTSRDGEATTRISLPYMQVLRSRAVLSLFWFRMSFTLCIGITWTFLPLMAYTQLGLSSSAIGAVVMVNVLVSGLLQVPMGYAADRISRTFLVTAGGFLGMMAMLYFNYASSFAKLLIGNGLLGLAGGISFPAIMALAVIEGRKTAAMGSLMGILAMAHSLGMLVGPLFAGLIIDLLPFRTVFFVGAVVLGAGTAVFLRSFRDD